MLENSIREDKMYKTIVRTRKILDDKNTLKKILFPLGIWLVLFFISFLIFIKVTYFALPFMFIIFFSIIPICYCCFKNTGEFRGEASFINKEVVFHAINGELYINNTRLNVKQNKYTKEIYVDDIMFLKAPYAGTTPCATFVGIVQEPYVNGFIDFLKKHNIRIDDSEL